MTRSKYSEYKIFHYPEKLASLPQDTTEIRAPVHIRIKPTNVCNHNCWYCAYKVDNLQLGQDMVEKDSIPEAKMMEIIDDCVDMGVEAITFSGGGEPFVYRHFLATIRKLSETSIAFSSLTNGSKLKGEVAELFSQYGTWLRISIDGWDDQSYSDYRGVHVGEFSKVVKNIENFKKLNGACALGISFIVDNKNYHHIFEFAKWMKELGVDSFKIAPCIVSNDGKETNSYHEPFYHEAKAQAVKTKQLLEDENFEVYDSYHLQLESFDKDYHWCPYLQINPVIGADLNVYACHDKAYNLLDGRLGSIKDVRFKEFWTSDKNQFFKINPSEVCNHHCMANQKNIMILDYLDTDSKHLPFV